MEDTVNILSAARSISILTFFCASAGAWANSYTIVDLGELKVPWAINTKQDIAAGGANPKNRAQVWRGGRWHRLGEPDSGGYGINGRGDVIGQVNDTAEIWPRREPPHVIAVPGGAISSRAFGIAQDRTIVGDFTAVVDGMNSFRCFVTDPEGNTLDLLALIGGTFCTLDDVNGLHQAVGEVGFDGIYGAFVWQDGQLEHLPELPGGTNSAAESVNASGDIVGDDQPAGGGQHAVLWSHGTVTDLGTDVRYVYSYAEKINDLGEIVGVARGVADQQPHAVRFADGLTIDLATEVTNLDDWVLSEATSISNTGIVVGQGLRPYMKGHKPEQREHGFMLIPQ
jgi:probable HAF family extracellular repeat protein